MQCIKDETAIVSFHLHHNSTHKFMSTASDQSNVYLDDKIIARSKAKDFKSHLTQLFERVHKLNYHQLWEVCDLNNQNSNPAWSATLLTWSSLFNKHRHCTSVAQGNASKQIKAQQKVYHVFHAYGKSEMI